MTSEFVVEVLKILFVLNPFNIGYLPIARRLFEHLHLTQLLLELINRIVLASPDAGYKIAPRPIDSIGLHFYLRAINRHEGRVTFALDQLNL